MMMDSTKHAGAEREATKQQGAGRAALIVVDVQPDFLPGGALAVEEGDEILEPLARLMEEGSFDLQVATQDWHPPGHVSFASRHPEREPFDVIELYGHEQVLWPDHCVQGSPGAELHADLPWERVSAVIRKGADPECDSYSGFRNNWNREGERPPTGLAGYLRERGVERVFVCGLARDYCVRWTAEDAVAAGFDTAVLWELTRSVDPSEDAQLRRSLEDAGIRVLEGRAE
ncbi:MAG TPA: bifunctional nicotinamidase/pyrazinamidase [Longimicrobiales bacterium]|nr:bifunctional nicotinamidase/pyrazinamidase [Longimicrobiales bacterium]